MLSKSAMILGAVLSVGLSAAHPQTKPAPASAAKPASSEPGKETFLKYCASCHGTLAKGDGPAAWAMNMPPPDLTTLTIRHEGKFPTGYVKAVIVFGKSFASHGSEDMPIWGARFRAIDPEHDPTGDQHINDLVAYIASLQVKERHY